MRKAPLAEAGFEVGDMILGINKQVISGVESFVTLMGSLKPHQQITLLALEHRRGNTGYVQYDPITLSKGFERRKK